MNETYVVREQATETGSDEHTVASLAVDIDQAVSQTLPKRLCVCGTKSQHRSRSEAVLY